VSCHDAREWLSDLLDDALEAETRAQVDTHLAGCADCRRELDRLRATVSLLRAVERPQAPAGFVDRVLEAARPAPWHRRLLDWLAAVRLLRFPVEAAAVVVAASLAVYVFQGTPALRQAARPEEFRGQVDDGSVSTKTPATPDVGPKSAGKEATERVIQGFTKSLRLPPPVPPAAPATPPVAEPEAAHEQHLMNAPASQELVAGVHNSPRVGSESAPSELARSAPGAPRVPQSAAPAPGAPFTLADPSSPTEGRRQLQFWNDSVTGGGSGAAERPTNQSRPIAPGPAPAPELRERLTREEQGQTERPAPAWIPATRAPGASVMRSAASVHVVGSLTVKDRYAANRELGELLSRVGGAETARRSEVRGDTVHLVVPRAAYPAFAQGLARIGAWVPEAEPPELPDRVPITLRITQ